MFAGLKAKVKSRFINLIDMRTAGLHSEMADMHSEMANLHGRTAVLEENVRNLNTMLKNYNYLSGIAEKYEKLQTAADMLRVKIAILEKHTQNQVKIQDNPADVAGSTVIQSGGGDVYGGIDYFDFENYFRGSMETIGRNQLQYLKYYRGRKNVVDLGCGRGEFLSLLRENEIEAKGVDFYEEFAEMCRMNGLEVVCDDALHFLKCQEKVGGIFAGQLIEHLTTSQIVELCETAYEKLEEGASIVMETPNPTCLAIYTHAFYLDPSHQKPVHPLMMKYILEKAGFKSIEIIYTDTSKLPVSIPAIKGIENADEFNEVMQLVSEALFGSQDYAIVGTK